jgi:hypothetical protein
VCGGAVDGAGARDRGRGRVGRDDGAFLGR